MTQDANTLATSGTAAPAAWVARDAEVLGRSRRRAPASRLVLVLGLTPWPEVAAALAPDGVRLLWLADVPAGLDAARLARFDAAVISSRTLGSGPVGDLVRLKRALGCPVLACAAPGMARPVDDEVLWLESGADAWVSAPATPTRLRAHLLALLRGHAPASPAADPGTPGDCPWRVDLVHDRLLGAQPQAIALTQAQAAILHCLIEARGRVVPRARLAQSLMPSHGHPLQTRSIDVYVHRLRLRLREAGARDHDIESVRSRGYCLSPAPEDSPTGVR